MHGIGLTNLSEHIAIELEYIDEIKTDPTINTISKSVLALKAKNADAT